MFNLIENIKKKSYPQNYLLKKPVAGSLIIAGFCFGFLMLYKPLNAQEANNLSYAETMALYCFATGVAVFATIKVLKRITWFSVPKSWTFLKEIAFIFSVLTSLGIAIYFLAFLIEAPAERWNLPTFADSFKYAFLTGILPLAFFTAINIQSLFSTQNSAGESLQNTVSAEEKIQIHSKLKKDRLHFVPSQFLYAESDGNYVNFYLSVENKIKKKVIRNSISDIEKQLLSFPGFLRIHRAFIVNLKKIEKKEGNSSGYRLKLKNTGFVVPVSRQNTKTFEEQFRKFEE